MVEPMQTLKRKALLLGAIFAIIFTILATTALGSRLARPHHLVVGAKNCTEQHILSEMMAIMIEEWLDIKVIRNFHLDNTAICFSALKSGEIDLYAEYTGTALTTILREPVTRDPKKSHVRVADALEREYGLKVLSPFGCRNAYALVMRREEAESRGIETLSDAQAHLSSMRIGFDPEFHSRPEKELLEQSYPELIKQKPLLMDHALLYTTLACGEINLIEGYATDGFILAHDLKVLIDDKKSLPAYDAVPILGRHTVERFPEIEKIIGKLEGEISTDDIQRLNYEVEKKGSDVYTIAKQFLTEKNLLKRDYSKLDRSNQSLGVGTPAPHPPADSRALSDDQNEGSSVSLPLVRA